jgi:acetate kinase
MGTRCGDIDAYIPLYIMQTQNKTADEVNQMMNKESGLWALSGGYSDTRDIEKMYNEGNERAVTTIKIYVHNVIKYIGAYTAEMGGVDAIIFTAGIGENSSFLRQKICERLKFMGIEIDEQKNKLRSQFVELSTPASKVKVYMIPTNEELVIAQDTYKLCA